MKLKIYYSISQDRAGIPMDYTGARHFVVPEGQAVEELAKAQLAADYQVPLRAVEIVRIAGCPTSRHHAVSPGQSGRAVRSPPARRLGEP